MGAVEITLVSFIALMTVLAGSCILSFGLKKTSLARAIAADTSINSSQRG